MQVCGMGTLKSFKFLLLWVDVLGRVRISTEMMKQIPMYKSYWAAEAQLSISKKDEERTLQYQLDLYSAFMAFITEQKAANVQKKICIKTANFAVLWNRADSRAVI